MGPLKRAEPLDVSISVTAISEASRR